MGIVNALAALFAQASPTHVAIIMAILSPFLLLTSHSVACTTLFVLFVVLRSLGAPFLLNQVVAVRYALALAIWIILLVSAQHAPQTVSSLRPWLPETSAEAGTRPRRRARFLYRVPTLALAGLIALGAWKVYPVSSLSASLNLAGYWAMALGVVLGLAAEDPLERGLGLLTMMGGFESLFLPAQRGLLIIGMVSILDLVIALAVVFTFEEWLAEEQAAGEGAP